MKTAFLDTGEKVEIISEAPGCITVRRIGVEVDTFTLKDSGEPQIYHRAFDDKAFVVPFVMDKPKTQDWDKGIVRLEKRIAELQASAEELQASNEQARTILSKTLAKAAQQSDIARHIINLSEYANAKELWGFVWHKPFIPQLITSDFSVTVELKPTDKGVNLNWTSSHISFETWEEHHPAFTSLESAEKYARKAIEAEMSNGGWSSGFVNLPEHLLTKVASAAIESRKIKIEGDKRKELEEEQKALDLKKAELLTN